MSALRALLRRVCYTQNTIRYRAEWRVLERAIQQIPHPVETLLDGGAGSGEYCRRLLAAGFCRQVKAVEFDDSNFACLKQTLGGDARAQLIQGSVLDIPLPDACADAVMSTQVIEHIAEHEKAASEFNRVLKPGGYAIISTPHPPEPYPNDDHVREGYTAEDLAALFAPHGWQQLWTDYFLTRATISRMLFADRTPLGGKWIPVAWVDTEAGQDQAAILADTPFGIMSVFKKPA